MSTATPGVPTPSTPPLTVVYVGNFRAPWCTEVHVAGSLEALGHRVHRVQEDLVDWPALPGEVDSVGGQLLLWTRTWHVDLAAGVRALEALRARGVPSVSYHLDRWWGLDREPQLDDEPFFRTDLVVSPDGAPHDWDGRGIRHLYLPPGVYHAECGPVPPRPQRFPHPVVFVGSHPYPHPEWAPYRNELIETLSAHFGRRFHVYPGARGRAIRGRALQELYATAQVVVGDSCLAGGATRYWSDRIPETLGRGGLLIHPRVVGLSEWYPSLRHSGIPDDEIPPAMLTYDLGEFRQVIDLAEWALKRPEISGRIAEEGRGLVLGRDTYAHRLNHVLGLVAARTGFREATRAPARPARARPPRSSRRDPDPPGSVSWTLGRRRGVFVPREIDLNDAGEFHVVQEVWAANDYAVPDRLEGTVLDLGANVGAFSVLAALSGAERVIAVEPDPENHLRLAFHVGLNGVSDRVEVMAAAVTGAPHATVAITGDGSGTHLAPIREGAHIQERSASGVVIADRHEPDEIPAGATVVRAITLSDLILTHEPVRFLKMDVEGAEFEIIAATPLEAFAQIEEIALEWHGPAMPHLAHLRGDEFGPLVAKLADWGRVSTFGHPARGGLLHGRRY